jgi:hypothetical protein
METYYGAFVVRHLSFSGILRNQWQQYEKTSKERIGMLAYECRPTSV